MSGTSIRDLAGELTALDREIARLAARRHDVAQALFHIVKVAPDGDEKTVGLRALDAHAFGVAATDVLRVVQRLGGAATRDQVQRALAEEGLSAESKQILNRLDYLRRLGHLRRAARGRYEVAGPPPAGAA